MFRTLLTALALLILSQSAQADVLGFRAWKNQRIEDAKSALERTNLESTGEKKAPAAKAIEIRANNSLMQVKKASKAESRINQAKVNLELATEFTINDYFVLYLSQHDSPEAIPEAAKKMSPDEVAELMLAYKKRLETNHADIGLVPIPAVTPSRL
jgi:hypothetical protein